MLGPGRRGGVDRREPLVYALGWQPHHQIETDIVEPGRPRFAVRGARPGRAVQARQPPEFIVSKRLDAEAETIDAGVTIGGKPRLGHALRIRFEGHLAVGSDDECLFASRDDPGDLGWLEER